MRYCSKCGNQLTDDQLYCPRCGNKEPFITNSDNSGWNNFEIEKKYEGNVNYDFQSKQIVNKTQNTNTPKSISILNKVSKIYSLCATVYFIASFISMVLIIVFTSKVAHPALHILNWVGLALFIIFIIIQITKLSLYAKHKIKTTKNSSAIPAIIMSLFGIGASIGQYFLLKNNSPPALFFFQFMLMLAAGMTNLSNSKVKVRV